MRKRFLSILQYILFFGGGVFLIWWQFHAMTPDQLNKFTQALSTANYWLLIPIITMALASHVSRAIRWQILIEPMGYKPSLFNVFGVTMIGYLANSFVPRLGEVLKCTLLGKYEKIPPQKLLGTILIERIFDVICYFIFIIFTVLIQYKLVTTFMKKTMADMANNPSSMPLGMKLGLCAVLVFALFCIWIFKKHPESKFVIGLKNFWHGLAEGFTTIKNLKKERAFLLHTAFIWSMYVLQIYVA
ncbi:MAG: flippase-like domain-containing protein, partial [Sphingobacteriales bacterium]|nr:flippase-like domain-containing protein [Sphingobacteriales bacterium]